MKRKREREEREKRGKKKKERNQRYVKKTQPEAVFCSFFFFLFQELRL